MDKPIDRCKQPKQKKELSMWNNFNISMLIATAVIAAATCVYVFYAYRQWNIMSEQLKQNQPLPGVARVNVNTVAEEVRRISVDIKNFGKTSAKHVLIGWKVDRLQRNVDKSTNPVTVTVTEQEIKGVSPQWYWSSHPISLFPEQELNNVIVMLSKDLFFSVTQGYDAIRVMLAVKYQDIGNSKPQLDLCTYLITRMASSKQQDPDIQLIETAEGELIK
jgi:hypothetical protein